MSKKVGVPRLDSGDVGIDDGAADGAVFADALGSLGGAERGQGDLGGDGQSQPDEKCT